MIPEFDGTSKQFARIAREMFPNCRICEDDEGQIVIYTGGALEMGGEVVQWLPDDEDVYRSWCDRNPEVM
jgi:hypothetical protein